MIWRKKLLLTIGQKIFTTTVHGDPITGSVAAILENTVIVSQNLTTEVVQKEPKKK